VIWQEVSGVNLSNFELIPLDITGFVSLCILNISEYPWAALRSAPHNQRMQPTARAGKRACPPLAADPRRLFHHLVKS